MSTVTFEDVRNVATGSNRLSNIVEAACNRSMPKGQYRGGKKAMHWWTKEIEDLWRKCHATRRRIKRGRCRGEPFQNENDEFRTARKEVKYAIGKSKKICWINLCKQIDRDPWGLSYKLVTKKLIGIRPIPGITLPRLERLCMLKIYYYKTL